VEKKTIEVEEKVEQPVEVEQSMDFSLAQIEKRFFDVEANFLDILVAIPTKARSKYMIRCKGKEHVEEGSSFAKMTQKQTLTEIK